MKAYKKLRKNVGDDPYNPPRGFSKKAAKKYAETSDPNVAPSPSKMFGKPLMRKKDEDTEIGYDSVSKTNLPKYKKGKPSTKQGRKSLRKLRGRP